MNDTDLQALANRVGSMFVVLQEYQRETADDPAHWWSDEEWLARWRVMKKHLSRLEAALTAGNQRLEDYGWTVGRKGDWRLLTESAPDEEPSPVEAAPAPPASTREYASTAPAAAEGSGAPPWDSW